METKNPTGSEAVTALINTYKTLKEEVAELLGTNVDNLAYTQSTNAGVSTILTSMTWQKGDIVILNKNEYIDGILPLLALKEKYGVEIIIVQDMDTVDFGSLVKCHSRVKIVFFSHLECNTGKTNDIKKISRNAREAFKNTLILVDGAQAVGQVRIENIECADFYVFPFHKWLLGPSGTGIIFSKNPKDERLFPIGISGLGAHKTSIDSIELSDTARIFENSSFNFWLYSAALTSIKYIKAFGIEKVFEHQKRLARLFFERLNDRVGPLFNLEISMSNGMVLIACNENKSSEVIMKKLLEHNIVCRTFEDDNNLRFCFHIYNEEKAVGNLATRLIEIVEQQS